MYLVPIFGMGLAVFFLFIKYKAKQLENKEKLALIAKGMDPALADPKQKKNEQNSFKTGLMLIGVAIGVVVGYILNLTLDIPNFVTYPTMVLVCCGLLLIYFHKSKIA